MPCWLIHGEQDPRPARTVATLADAIPAAQFHLIPDAGHQPWRERPADFQRLLRSLLYRSSEIGSVGTP
jgi:proline iminopeptidase